MSTLLICQSKVGRDEECSYQVEGAFNPSRAEGRVKEEERPCSKTKGFEEDRKRLLGVVCVCVIKPRVSLSTHGKTDLHPQV